MKVYILMDNSVSYSGEIVSVYLDKNLAEYILGDFNKYQELKPKDFHYNFDFDTPKEEIALMMEKLEEWEEQVPHGLDPNHSYSIKEMEVIL